MRSADADEARIRGLDTVLLDAGGVLLDLDYAYLSRLMSAQGELASAAPERVELARHEAVARREVHRLVEQGRRTSEAWRDYFHIILARSGVPVERQSGIIDSLWEAHQRFGLWTVAIEGGPAAVAELRGRGYKVGVVSNAEGRVARDLARAGYDGMFETVVDSHVVGVEKPDPAIFRIALERLGAEAERALFLGDVPAVDVEGARAAGLLPVLLDRHGLYPENPVLTVDSVRGLLALLPPEAAAG